MDKTTYEYILSNWMTRCEDPIDQHYGNVKLLREYATDKVVQHRTKPDPLTPTALGPYVTTKTSYGREQQDVLYGNSWCFGGGYGPYVYHSVRHTSVSNVPFMGAPTDEWNRRYLNEIRDLSSDVSGIVAEIDETTRMIVDFCKILSDVQGCITNPLGKACPRLFKRLGPISWRTIPSAILLNNFAIKPLVSGLHDVATVLKDPEYSLKRDVKFRISANDRYDDGCSSGSRRIVMKTSATVVLKDDGFISRVNFGNPLEWAWERIPFSFVVDWIMPVGGFIQAIGTLSKVQSASGTLTMKSSVSASQYKSYNEAYKYKLIAPAKYEAKEYKRLVIGLPSLPVLFTYRPSKSIGALTNAVSLLAVLSKRK
jgi:hypothetical protein